MRIPRLRKPAFKARRLSQNGISPEAHQNRVVGHQFARRQVLVGTLYPEPLRGAACPRLLWLNGTGKTTVSVVKSRQFNPRASRDVHLKTMQPADPELASSWCSGLLVRGVSADRHSGPRRPCLRELIRIVAGPACSVRFERGFSCCRVSAGWEHLFRAWNLEILFRACSRW